MSAFESAVSKIRGENQFFSLTPPVCISRAPGRLDLMGGNVDYTGGLVKQPGLRHNGEAIRGSSSGIRR